MIVMSLGILGKGGILATQVNVDNSLPEEVLGFALADAIRQARENEEAADIDEMAIVIKFKKVS